MPEDVVGGVQGAFVDPIPEGPSADYEVGLESLSQWQLAWRKFKKHRLALIGLGILLTLFIVAIIGSIAGYVGGFVDNILMRAVDVMLSLPLLFVILVAAKFFASARDNVWQIIIIFGLFVWMGVARLVRSLFLSIREREFVETAKAVVYGTRRLIF